jgi:hypothetical protein
MFSITFVVTYFWAIAFKALKYVSRFIPLWQGHLVTTHIYIYIYILAFLLLIVFNVCSFQSNYIFFPFFPFFSYIPNSGNIRTMRGRKKKKKIIISCRYNIQFWWWSSEYNHRKNIYVSYTQFETKEWDTQ